MLENVNVKGFSQNGLSWMKKVLLRTATDKVWNIFIRSLEGSHSRLGIRRHSSCIKPPIFGLLSNLHLNCINRETSDARSANSLCVRFKHQKFFTLWFSNFHLMIFALRKLLLFQEKPINFSPVNFIILKLFW